MARVKAALALLCLCLAAVGVSGQQTSEKVWETTLAAWYARRAATLKQQRAEWDAALGKAAAAVQEVWPLPALNSTVGMSRPTYVDLSGRPVAIPKAAVNWQPSGARYAAGCRGWLQDWPPNTFLWAVVLHATVCCAVACLTASV